jgi:hypothetical protein
VRTIIAIRIVSVEVGSNVPELRYTLSHDDTEAGGWSYGPPYAVEEVVFDEHDFEGCSRESDGETVLAGKE